VGYSTRLASCNLWGLTGTPMTSDKSELDAMLRVLGQAHSGLKVSTIDPPLQMGQSATVTAAKQNQAYIEKLRKLMIRHTKAQQIHGQAALALPELNAATVWLDMTPLERRAYGVAKDKDHKALLLANTHEAAKPFRIAMGKSCISLFLKF